MKSNPYSLAPIRMKNLGSSLARILCAAERLLPTPMKPQNSISHLKSFIAAAVFFGALFFGVIPAGATTYYWNTTGTNAWTDTTKWSSNSTGIGGTGTAPLTSDSVVFNGSSITSGSTWVTLLANTSVEGLTFNLSGSNSPPLAA